VFTPEGGGEPVYTDLPPYVWNGTGNPCIDDPDKGADHADNKIEGPEHTENEPETDGTVTVEIVKFSCVDGYEPGEGEPNGYPEP
jgi:hypothetical protein